MIKTIKDLNKKLIIAFVIIAMSGLGMLIKPANAYAQVMFGNESNKGKEVYNLERGEITLDPQNPIIQRIDLLEGTRDTRRWTANNPKSDWIEDIHLECGRDPLDQLRVVYTAHSKGIFSDVNFRFTIEAVNRDGECTSTWIDEDWKYSNSTDSLAMNSWDLDSGNGKDGNPFHNYDGVFHLVKIEVWD